ncbi:MAG: response regulator transcription factor [Betaproteobacteria bacterium]|nr:response regulator transcription factor [Betaproteobacteria bacterium]
MTVFLVEDSPLLRERLSAMLSGIPASVLVGYAETAKDAIEGIVEKKPDVVVLDLSLKDSNGFDVLRAIRTRAPSADAYVLTNHPIEGFRKVAERLGAKGFFDKSTEFDKLRELLKHRAAGAAA